MLVYGNELIWEKTMKMVTSPKLEPEYRTLTQHHQARLHYTFKKLLGLLHKLHLGAALRKTRVWRAPHNSTLVP
jgi:hypothetical protein